MFFGFNLYRGMWRYTSLYDVFNIARAMLISAVTLFLINWLIPTIPKIPRSIFILDLGISAILITGIRLGIRIYYTQLTINGDSNDTQNRLVIIGAGDAGEQLLREINHVQYLDYDVVGFLDDDKEKVGSRLHGIPVLSEISNLPDLTVEFDEILIAIPSANSKEMRRIINLCKQTSKPFMTVPGLGEIVNGQVNFHTVRDVGLTDIIGREEVELDSKSLGDFLEGKRVLITGAGGSIGSELVRQCFYFNPAQVIMLDNSEYNLFKIQQECQNLKKAEGINPVLADIRDKEMMDIVFEGYEPEVIFHAAAYKHVPLQEEFPWQAIHTNVWGTQNMISLSTKHHAEKFILVSTDKAVSPTSVMGASKRLAELLVHGNGVRTDTRHMAVRFGNVIGSSGSVVPIFKEQIQKGGPVTVTHPEIERYFMSIPEASQLILQAGALGRGGEIFVLDMGKPIKIDTIARVLIELSGYEPDVDIPIIYTGLRPGEKMYEELIDESEHKKLTEHKKIMILESSYDMSKRESLENDLDELYHLSKKQDKDGIINKLSEILPLYKKESYFDFMESY